MVTGKDTIVGTDRVVDAFLTKDDDDKTELFAIASEVETARGGTASLDTRLDAFDTAIAALTTGDATMVSANDTTAGYLNGKLVAGEGIDLTEGNDGGDETLTVSCEDATTSNKGIASFVSGHFSVSSGAVSGRFRPPENFTGNDTITTAELAGNKTCTNSGAAGEVNITLPAGASGYGIRFVVITAQYLKVTANGTETFKFFSTTGAAGGYIRSNVPGTSWYIEWLGGAWWITELQGTLNFDE